MRRYGIPLIAMVLAALSLARGGVLSAEGTAVGARLTAISSTAEGRKAAVLIEASEPVAYLASQPDASTLLLELRNVQSAGFANGFTARPGSPVRAVSVEDASGAGGERVARVRVALAGPLTPRVRSQRNLIFVEVDSAASAAAAVDAAPEPIALRSLRTEIGPDGVSLLLGGIGGAGPERRPHPGRGQPAPGARLPERHALGARGHDRAPGSRRARARRPEQPRPAAHARGRGSRATKPRTPSCPVPMDARCA